MSKIWNINIGDEIYTIHLKSSKVQINGEVFKLKSLLKKFGYLKSEYELPVGRKKALLVTGGMVAGTNLYIDGIECITGKPYEPLVLPKWAYIFIIIHVCNLLNGAIGGLCAVMGVSLTVYIATNTKMNSTLKLILNILVLILAAVIVFSAALAITLLFGR